MTQDGMRTIRLFKRRDFLRRKLEIDGADDFVQRVVRDIEVAAPDS